LLVSANSLIKKCMAARKPAAWRRREIADAALKMIARQAWPVPPGPCREAHAHEGPVTIHDHRRLSSSIANGGETNEVRYLGIMLSPGVSAAPPPHAAALTALCRLERWYCSGTAACRERSRVRSRLRCRRPIGSSFMAHRPARIKTAACVANKRRPRTGPRAARTAADRWCRAADAARRRSMLGRAATAAACSDRASASSRLPPSQAVRTTAGLATPRSVGATCASSRCRGAILAIATTRSIIEAPRSKRCVASTAVEQALARLKDWRILRDHRRRGRSLSQTLAAVAFPQLADHHARRIAGQLLKQL